MATNVSHIYPLILLLLFTLFSHSISLSPNGEQSKPFEFLKQFHGTHKGDKVQGLGELARYLKKFGYLNYPHPPNGTHVDDFDELLEKAIKTYELNYHLSSTGTLDAATLTKMMMPQCGVPDINNGKTSMRSGKKNQVHGSCSSFIHTVPHYNFFPGWPRWPASKTHLTYAFLSQADVLGPLCARAFENWDSVTHFTFEEIQNCDVADVKISFQIGDHGDRAGAFDGPHGVLAHSFAPEDGRVHFDGQDLWPMIPLPGAFDLETVASHEIGHILGLDHSSDEDAIMYPLLPFGA
ncbi:hypothetical protein ACSBR2_036104 [Camellia fascicularis]